MSALISAFAYSMLAILTIGGHRVIAVVRVVAVVRVPVGIHVARVAGVVRVRGPQPPPSAFSDALY